MQIDEEYFLQITIWPKTFNDSELQLDIPSFPFKHHRMSAISVVFRRIFFLDWVYV